MKKRGSYLKKIDFCIVTGSSLSGSKISMTLKHIMVFECVWKSLKSEFEYTYK